MCDDYEERPERGYGVIPAIETFITNYNYTKTVIKGRICIIKNNE